MSIKVMSWVWSDCKDVGGTQLLVLLALADNANDEGHCWPALATIGAKARVSKATVVRTLNVLEEMGLVVRERQGGQPGDAWKSTHYYIQVPWMPRLSQPTTRGLSQGDTTLVSTVTQGLYHSYEPRTVIEPSKDSLSSGVEVHPLQAWFESIGVMVLPTDLPAFDELVSLGVTVDDCKDGLAWWHSAAGPRKPIRSVTQFSETAKASRLKRMQAAAPAPAYAKRAPAQQMGGMATMASKGEGPKPGESIPAWRERVRQEALAGMSPEDREYFLGLWEAQSGRSDDVGVDVGVAK